VPLAGRGDAGYNAGGDVIRVSLLVNVAQLLQESVGATRDMEVDGGIQALAGETVTPVRGKVQFTRTDQGIWAQGQVEVGLDMECGRCLVPFAQMITLDLHDMFVPMVDVVTGAPVKGLSDADEELNISAHHILDLTEVVRQYLVAATPLLPLCQPQCQGLCPQCGADLNEDLCGCAAQGDPRWAPLQRLLASQTNR
jgi:uncharacterized protein